MLMPFCRTALFAAVAAVLLPSASAYAAENISEAGQDADGWYLFDFTVSGYEEINNMIEDVRDYAFEGTIATHQAVIATDAEAEQTQIGLSAVHGTKTSNASSIAVENSYSGSGSAKAKGYLELSKDKFPALSSSGNPWLIQSEDAKEGDWPIAVTIVPSFYYQKNFDIKLVSYGMEGTNAELENAGSISVRSNVSFELDAQTSFYLGSSTQTGVDNDLPTADEVSQLKQDVSWTITPAGEVTASIEASIIAVGMRAVSGSGQAASAVNSGSIVIEGSALFTGSVTAGLAEGSLSSTAVTGGDHTFTLTITDGNVTGNVTAEGDIYAAGLMGTADATSSEDGSESTENSPAVTAAETDGDGEAQETFSYTLLSNSGTIKIISDENFDAFGMYAKASNNGTVFAENYGLIDLSEAKVESPYSYRAQLLAEYSSGGSVVLGDWTMAVSELQLGYVPFVVSGSGEGGLTVNPGSTLYLVFDRAEQIGQQVTVTQLFGAYDEEKNAASESTALPTADGSTFSRLLAGTDMIVLDGGITGNSAAFTATVDPSRSVGEEARYMALTSALNRYLTLRGLTQDRVRMSEDGFSLMAIPWYTHDNVDGANGYQTRGYSLALKGAWKSGAIDASAYFAGGHESLEGHRHQTEGSSDTYSIGAAARYWLTDSFYAGARFDYGYADTDWTVSDRLGSDSADASAQTAYLGLSAGVLQRFGAQSIGAELAAGWLHLKQDALSVAPIGTGRTSHASESIDTALITAETYWQGVFDVDGYAVKPQLTLSAAYLTNTDFGEGFEYLSRRYVNAYELEDFYGSASAGIGFEKGNGCLEAKLGYRAASDFSSYTADLRFTWKF